MADASEPSDASDDTLFDRAVPDAANTLGGILDDIEPEHPSVIAHMVRSLMPGQDLTRVTIPSFFLEPRSLLERLADTLMHPDVLLRSAQAAEPLERMKLVVAWFLSGFHYKTVGVKKPFNPVIGETFACMWKHDDGSRSQYFSEQVAHRPPVSAIYFENRRHGITASAHVWTKSQFSAPQTVKSILDGVCLLHFAELDEEYYITFPTYYAHNLLIGTLRTDIGDTAHIICSKTGLRADIDFLQMGVLSPAERLFGVEGLVRRMPEGHAAAALKKAGWFTRGSTPEGEPVAAVSGHFTKSLFWTPTGGAQQLLLDIAKAPVAPKYVLPQELQGPWESRRLWRFAAADLLVRPKVDWASVDHEKAQLEEEQRLVPCHAAKHGAAGFEEWPTKKFHLVKIPDLIAGGEREVYLYDGFDRKKRADDAAESNLLALSRSLPDPRGGLKGAGAKPAYVAALRSIVLSKRRQADLEKF